MRGKTIVSLLLISMFATLVMVNIQHVKANPSVYDLYVDGFTSAYVDWNTFGTQPWLNAIDYFTSTPNYIESSQHCELMAWFTFDNIALAPGEVITKVVIEGYTWTQGYDENLDVDLYDSNWVWIGSLWGDSTWAWRTPRWVVGDLSTIVPQTLTVTGLNNFAVLLHYYTSTGGGSLGPFKIDSLRLKVYTVLSATINFVPPVVGLGPGGPSLLSCIITLPSSYLASTIDQSTIMLDGTIAPVAFGTPSDGTLVVWFSMSAVKNHIQYDLLSPPPPPPAVQVTLTVTFSLTSGTSFVGSNTVHATP